VIRDRGLERLSPPWWSHQRHVLIELRRSAERLLAGPAMTGDGQQIVDLGCGDRPYEQLLTGKGAKYIACDLEGDVDVRIEPGRPIPLDDASADGIVSFQVLEHVWDIDWYLGECYRILKPGGWLLLSTHGTWLYHPHPTDFRRWTRDGLIGELGERNLEVEFVEGLVGPLAWTTQFRLLGFHHLLSKFSFLGRLILLPIACLMNLRMVLEDAITPASIRETNACVYVTLSRKPR
jgi:SAM-dependent methyltransferase